MQHPVREDITSLRGCCTGRRTKGFTHPNDYLGYPLVRDWGQGLAGGRSKRFRRAYAGRIVSLLGDRSVKRFIDGGLRGHPSRLRGDSWLERAVVHRINRFLMGSYPLPERFRNRLETGLPATGTVLERFRNRSRTDSADPVVGPGRKLTDGQPVIRPKWISHPVAATQHVRRLVKRVEHVGKGGPIIAGSRDLTS